MSWSALTIAFVAGAVFGGPFVKPVFGLILSACRCLRIASRDAWRARWGHKAKQFWMTLKWAAHWEFVVGAEVSA